MIERELPTSLEEKQSAADAAIKALTKEFGSGVIIDMHGRVIEDVPAIPTGLYSLDYNVIGVGGIPKGRITEIFGPEASGKTSLALLTVATAQRAGGLAAFIDVEHALDPSWATLLGVDMETLTVSQPDSGEQALRIAEALIESYAYDVVVVDSVAALTPRAEIDGEIGDATVGALARLMSQACRKLTAPISKSGTAMIFINQIREKIGVMYGSPETTPGGRALKFYSSLRIDIRRTGMVKKNDMIIGSKTKIKAGKNKLAAPFRETEVEILYHRGFDKEGDLFDTAVAAKVIDKSGSWFAYKGERLGQGRDNAIQALTEMNQLESVYTELRNIG